MTVHAEKEARKFRKAANISSDLSVHNAQRRVREREGERERVLWIMNG